MNRFCLKFYMYAVDSISKRDSKVKEFYVTEQKISKIPHLKILAHTLYFVMFMETTRISCREDENLGITSHNPPYMKSL